MIVVVDASPLVFLGKIGSLELITDLFGDGVLLPESVREEVLRPHISPAEKHSLEAYLSRCTTVRVARPRHYSSAMSRADNAALTLAARRGADILLADDRVLRQMAAVEGIRPIGTLGIVFRGMRAGLVSAGEAKRRVDSLIRDHGFRISIELYEAVLSTIG